MKIFKGGLECVFARQRGRKGHEKCIFKVRFSNLIPITSLIIQT